MGDENVPGFRCRTEVAQRAEEKVESLRLVLVSISTTARADESLWTDPAHINKRVFKLSHKFNLDLQKFQQEATYIDVPAATVSEAEKTAMVEAIGQDDYERALGMRNDAPRGSVWLRICVAEVGDRKYHTTDQQADEQVQQTAPTQARTETTISALLSMPPLGMLEQINDKRQASVGTVRIP
eukprot:jgi/Ulvmu1/2856/UM145_0011.1